MDLFRMFSGYLTWCAAVAYLYGCTGVRQSDLINTQGFGASTIDPALYTLDMISRRSAYLRSNWWRRGAGIAPVQCRCCKT